MTPSVIPQLVFLVGPTAVGKSAVALELAPLINAEIVSADSMQVYRGMDIGTAKPTATERRSVPHHLIDICNVTEPFDAKQFSLLAATTVAKISEMGKTTLVVGGSGLYVRALRRGLFEGPGRDPSIRAKLEMMSADRLAEELRRVDPQTATKIDCRNPRRLVRALEVFYSTGRPMVEMQKQWDRAGPSTSGFCLNRERTDLHSRIEQRIDAQITAGWVGEVRQLMQRGLERNRTAMQAAGYKELVSHLRGEISLEQAVARIKARTRQLARRQLTWFRREPDLVWIHIEKDEPPETTAKRIQQKL